MPGWITTASIALVLAGVLVLATGWYTDNGGLQLAGLLILVGSGAKMMSDRSQRNDPS